MMYSMCSGTKSTYCNLHTLACHLFKTAHHVLLHLNELGEFLGQIGAKSTGSLAAERMACEIISA